MAFKRTKLTNVASKTITPTTEQVYNMELVRSGKNVKIVAGAGTGKSSSLRYIASSIPDKNFLVLCFNAANAVESNEHPDRPENIFYSTIHSVAYKAIVDFKFKKKLGGFLDYKDLPDNVEHCLPNLPEKEQYKALVTVQKAMLECITYFCRSDSESILDFVENKLRYEFTFTEKRPNLLGELELSNDAIKKLTLLTGSYWHSLINSDSSSKISHDVYLKMFQLSKEPIDEVYDKQSKRYVRIDVVMLDEAQDTNPVSEAVFAVQDKQKVLVGDPMQQLYAWRGAGKAMDGFTDFAVGQLTESFRFNSTIADKANLILRKGGSTMQLIGSGSKTSVDTKAHLCRTNASVVSLMLNYLGTSEKIYTSIDLKGTFGKLYHMQACFFNEKPMYPSKELSSIVDKKSLLLAMEYSEDLRRLDKLRQSFISKGGSITSVKKDLDKLIVATPEEATLVISTIHASKGMEYCSVTIDDDFLTIPEGVHPSQVIDEFWKTDSLICLLYVGVTRAKVQVQLPYYFNFI